MTTTPDQFDAVRSVTKAIEGFSPEEQKRILRWAAETVGIAVPAGSVSGKGGGIRAGEGSAEEKTAGGTDIKSFYLAKHPKNDLQFATLVAYYHRFEAKEEERKTSIKAADLVDAIRKVNRARIPRPDQTLVNTENAGLLDKVGAGSYAINSVGENLIAVTLPGGAEGVTAKMLDKKIDLPKRRYLPRRRNNP